MQLHQEGRLTRQREHAFLHHRAFHVVVLDNDVLLEDLDGVELVGAFPLRQQHLELTDPVETRPRESASGYFQSSEPGLTLPKLPLPSTIRKLKSLARIRSLLPMLCGTSLSWVGCVFFVTEVFWTKSDRRFGSRYYPIFRITRLLA